jgi:hypothetical protein
MAAAPRTGPTVVLTGMIGGQPHLGGLTWVALNQLLGLRDAGCEAHLLEPVPSSALTSAGAPLHATDNAAYFRAVLDAYDLTDAATLWCPDTGETLGRTYAELTGLCGRTDVLLNVGGSLTEPQLIDQIPVRAYLDLDPGFTQLWAADVDMRLADHNRFVTVGPLLGTATCPVPTLGLPWIGMVPPVSLRHWPASQGDAAAAFTTVASWRGYGSVWQDGVHYGQKAHAMRPLLDLTGRTDQRLRLALEIHPDERADLDALRHHRWPVVDPADVAATPQDFQGFVTGSKGELGIAKLGYLAGRTGWFSDRSACYLAAGRPVLAHDTGFGAHLPVGEGLLAFTDVDEAAAGLAEIAADYPRHASAARGIAEEHLAADKVMGDLLDRLAVR